MQTYDNFNHIFVSCTVRSGDVLTVSLSVSFNLIKFLFLNFGSVHFTEFSEFSDIIYSI